MDSLINKSGAIGISEPPKRSAIPKEVKLHLLGYVSHIKESVAAADSGHNDVCLVHQSCRIETFGHAGT
jgi:hypothetical protein